MGKIASHFQVRWTRARFERHTEQWLPALYRTARRLTRDESAAEDLVQDTYVKAYQAFNKADLRSESNCRAWLLRILVNTFRDRYRRQQRSPEYQPFVGPHDSDDRIIQSAVSPVPNPEVLLGQKNFSQAAQAAIADLSPEVRLVVTLFVVEGLAYKDIAEIVDCPIGTVMSRLSRGRRQLRQHLQAYRETAPAVQPPERSPRAQNNKR